MLSAEAKIRTVYVIVNPISGKKNDEAASVIQEALKEAGIEAQLFLTEKAGDGQRFAEEGIKKGVDAMVVYGGDGTILEVAHGVMGTDVPLFIVPGGSANVLATEVGIPKDVKEACSLFVQPLEIRTIDAGRLNDGYFLVRTSLGFQADMVKGADRETKKKVGWFAYALSAFARLNKIKLAVYTIQIDGTERRTKGLTCIVTNAGNLGFSNISMDKNIDINDGLLDVLVVRKANLSLVKHFAATFMKGERPDNWDLVAHWQGKDIRVTTDPKQTVECDGEIIGNVSFHAKIMPAAIKIFVPAAKLPDTILA